VPYSVLMPVFAQDVLRGRSTLYGVLVGASGLGALAGAAMLAARRTVVGLGKVIAYTAVGFGVGIILFGLSRSVWISVPLLVITGFCMTTQMSASNALLQTIVDDDKRGRVMSMFAMAFQGMMPLGSLLAGVLAQPHRLGAPGTVMVGGACCIVGAGAFASRLAPLREQVRPIYVKRGLLPPVAAGLAATAELSVPPEQQ